MSKRRICVVVNSRANYGRIKSVMRAVMAHPDLDLQVLIGASALLHRFGNVMGQLQSEGFPVHRTIHSIVEGETPTTMAKSTGLGILELASAFEDLRPDIVLTVADRFETIATAIAGSYMNIMVAHTQGGEVTGSIDEGVRHAVTKLAHIHFPATARAAENVIRMGEDPAFVHMVGCPAMDVVAEIDKDFRNEALARYKGVGPGIDIEKPFLLVMQHPVTTEYGHGLAQVNETLAAVVGTGLQAIWLWPNVDAGSDDISKGLRMFRESSPAAPVHFFRNFSPEDYVRVLIRTACQVGNSSSALREGSFLGVPAVNIGTRQSGREHGDNVIHAGNDSREIEAAIRKQLAHGRYKPSPIFGDGQAGQRIAEVLAQTPLVLQKRLTY